ncbi:flagellar hook protein FlgE [Yoonia sediminilitoris]|uniref:Flagellar hook protein FlgE n=1 Tax=Yoonia sediminilitoris TaxID=1286148 RepID=A0A2T6K9Y7_9RHOB|nr:flagellar hook-basal body complex protein [Yoonia sediminilitoris]PUB11553.1 flagellar hook protein FlgE [Yoonia sediminilitoris]RCW91753.1 flagellar hook protein FlgE [Yoonia sediminilitoris]
MTISSSLNASVAGLAANASRLATISDNISNSSTYGYKRAVTDFDSMVIESGRGTYSAGGVRTTTSRLIDERGSLVSTSNPTDLAVRGRGMLPVTPEAAVTVNNGDVPLLLTTTGSFRPDAQGFLRSPGGLILLGVPALADGSIPNYPRDSVDGLVPVQINANQFAGEATTRVDLSVNLPATSTREGAAGDNETLSVEYFDNLGASSNLSFTFTPTVPAFGASNEWTMVIQDSESDVNTDGIPDVVGEYALTFDDSRGGGGTLLNVTTTSGGPYDPATGVLTIAVDGGPMEINIGELGSGIGLTQLSNAFSPTSISKNGTPVGSLTSIEVDPNGYIRASFDIGINRVLYQIPLVDVPNVNGLETLDQQSFRVTPDSGTFFLWDAGDGPTGDIVGYAREESATDVAGELTNLIQTQRAYSSNAKVIQTVDEMLQETTNIKR